MSFTETYALLYGNQVTHTPSVSALAPAIPKAKLGVEPVITNLPDKGTKTLILDSFYIATYIESLKEIQVYNYVEGKLKYSIPCEHPVKKLHMDPGTQRFYAQFEGDTQVKAWNIYHGNPIEVPETWKKIDKFSIGRYFIFTSEPLAGENRPIRMNVFDVNELNLKHTISTEFFKIHDMVENTDRLFITGIDSNPNNKAIAKNGMLSVYTGLSNKDVTWYKKTYPYDSDVVPEDVLNVSQGFVYNNTSTTSLTTVWDANTYSGVLARKAVKDQDKPCFTSSLGYTIATSDSKQISIYRVDGEVEGCYSGALMNLKEIQIEQKDGTKLLGKARTIEITQDNPLTTLLLFNNGDYLVTPKSMYLLVEGYANGLVRVRKLDDLSIWREFHPLENMKNVISCQNYYSSGRLLVHYGTPSSDGTLALVWDLTTQTPVQAVTREALKDRPYDSSQDIVMPYYSSNLVVQSENQVLYYKDVFESSNKS